ncbi:hypothetical protein WJX84_009634 [Apatococcus fuscideae]|uniref:Uncharacterized protein n=1 Tax=Apatococcus fuscideae TaxID=2026836 RepID=A0AAW1T3P2_9CHLO
MKLRFCLLHFSLPLKAVVRDCCAATWVFILEQLTFPSFQRLAKRHKHSAVQLTRLDQKKVLQRALTGLEKANGPGNLKDPAGVFVSSDDQNLPEGDYVFIPAGKRRRVVDSSDDDEEHVAKRSKRGFTSSRPDGGQAGTGSNGEGDAEDPDLTGSQLTSSPKAQAILQLLACCALAEHPMAIFLTDGMRYHKLHLRGEALHVRPDMQPRQAVYNMLQMLREASKDPLFRLERHKDDPKLDQQAAASVQHLRQVPLSLTLLCIAFKLHVFHDYCRYPVQYIMPHRSRAWNTYSLALTF